MVMNVKADTARTYIQAAHIVLNWDDVQTAVGTGVTEVIKLPKNSRVVGGFVHVDTLFATSGTALLDLGDPADDDEYTTTQINLEVAASTALVLTHVKYTVETILSATVIIGTAATTAGQMTISVQYVEEDRAHEQIPLAAADYSAARGAAA